MERKIVDVYQLTRGVNHMSILEIVEILVDPSASQTYTEDCYVCCRPILIDATISEGKAVIQVTQEDLGF